MKICVCAGSSHNPKCRSPWLRLSRREHPGCRMLLIRLACGKLSASPPPALWECLYWKDNSLAEQTAWFPILSHKHNRITPGWRHHCPWKPQRPIQQDTLNTKTFLLLWCLVDVSVSDKKFAKSLNNKKETNSIVLWIHLFETFSFFSLSSLRCAFIFKREKKNICWAEGGVLSTNWVPEKSK